MAKKRTPKKTYTEFLSWLEGVESMQSEDWVPDAHQWKTIREMLNNVKPDVKEVNKPVTSTQQSQGQGVARMVPGGQPTPPPVQPPMIPPAASGFDAPPVSPQRQPQVAPRPSGVPAVPSGPKGNILDTGDQHNSDEFI